MPPAKKLSVWLGIANTFHKKLCRRRRLEFPSYKIENNTQNESVTRSDIADELIKAQKLVEKGQCDVYLLVTNAGITGASSAKIEGAFRAVGVKNVLILGAT